MFTKFKNFCEKPITYGAYLKMCGTVLGLYGVGILSYLGYVKYQDYQDRKACEEYAREALARINLKKEHKESEWRSSFFALKSSSYMKGGYIYGRHSTSIIGGIT